MIDKNVVKGLVEEWLKDKEYFLVDLNISPDDKITVEIDHADGVRIEDCAQLSQYIEDHLNRDEEDYELEVGSAGLGQPFKVAKQYEIFIGEPVEVLDGDGRKVKAVVDPTLTRHLDTARGILAGEVYNGPVGEGLD